MKKFLYEITKTDDDQRIDRWLKRNFPLITQSYIEKLCRKGLIKVNNKKIKASQKVKYKDIVIHPLLIEKKEIKKSYLKDSDKTFVKNLIIFEDKYYIVINKPPQIASQGGTKQEKKNIDDIFKKYSLDLEEKPRLIHRLDKETSGIMILGKSRKSTKLLSEQFKNKLVKKIYWALLIGNFKEDKGEIKTHIVKDKGQFEKMKCLNSKEVSLYKNSKLSITQYKVMERLQKKMTWVALEPVTGRTHQLRVHMSEKGNPILGDKKYLSKNKKEYFNDKDLKNIIDENNLFLHSRSLSFWHPFTKKKITFYAELPPHMKKMWDFFEWDRNLFE